MSPTVKPTEVQDIATRRVERLRLLSFVEIAALPTLQDDVEQVRDRQVPVAIYRDSLPDGRIRVVVQAYFHRILGIGTMTADGFIITFDNTRSPVPQEMMWEFV
ncbi:MAG: hypothetical protein Q7U75_15955 [Desulfobacterales bacterium]|nr:hypothetical protein [Desulfobacterales bacterium]